ncbi:MAG: ribosome assembly cofactor RimP [Pseudoflavonifractor sp.]|nr:ribosome assembly cofactor RimP [Alloprevotella sp.]MCM1116154.1 ribosome assembly cofactor RimP [Pseudoflavonifractor sp.]
MIDQTLLRQAIEQEIEMTDAFIVDLSVSGDNRIVVEIDSLTGVDLDECVRLTRAIEARFDRDREDYELEVGSAGLTAPFKVRGQYEKNLGNDVEILTRDGKKLHGRLEAIGEGEGMDFPFTVAVAEKVKEPGKKRPVTVERELTLRPADVKTITYDIKFK